MHKTVTIKIHTGIFISYLKNFEIKYITKSIMQIGRIISEKYERANTPGPVNASLKIKITILNKLIKTIANIDVKDDLKITKPILFFLFLSSIKLFLQTKIEAIINKI